MHNSRILLSEDVSPLDIAVLSLVRIYVHSHDADIAQNLGITVLDLIDHEPFFDENNNIIVIPGALDLCNKIKIDSGSSSTQSIHHLLEALWNIDSVESLDTSLTNMIQYVSDHDTLTYKSSDFESTNHMKFSPRLAIGNWIQVVVANLHLLHHDELFLLFEAFASFREPTRQMFMEMGGLRSLVEIEKLDPDQGFYLKLKKNIDSILETDISFPKDLTKQHDVNIVSVSKYDLQSLLNKQITILETQGVKTPQRLKDIMKLMTSGTSSLYLIQAANLTSVPSYYYIKFLECLYDLDYQGSLQALHQYFDYMISSKSKYFYHYALISRATLHQYFGEDERALDAIEEAISVARENKDNVTLTFVLSWLFNFMKDKPKLWEIQNFYHNNNELHLLDFLVKKSKTVSLPLYCLSYHFETLHVIDNKGSMNRYLESLLKGTYVSIHDSPLSFVKSMEMSSVVWSRIGSSSLGDLYSSIAQEFADKSGKKSDNVAIEVRSANLDYLKGDAEKGYERLEDLKRELDLHLDLYKNVFYRSLIMLIKININKGRIKVAEQLLQSLNGDVTKDIELRTDIVYLNAVVQVSSNNLSKALSTITTYLDSIDDLTSQTKPNVHMILRLNILLSQIFNKSGSHVRAISLVIQLMQQAKKIGFITIIVEGLITLASILNNMNSFKDAYVLLSNKMATILTVNNREFTSTAYFELARSCFYMCKVVNSKDLLNKFLRYLNCCINGFKQHINLPMLKQCFKLEEEMAKLQKSSELFSHSQQSLERLDKRLIEEITYRYI